MTTTTNELKLLKCPFCGGEPILNEIEPHAHHLMFNGHPIMHDYPGSWTIECCDVGMIKDTREEVIAAWNRRSEAHGEPSDDGERKFHAARLRRAVKLVGLENAVPKSDDGLLDCMGSILGMVAGKIESLKAIHQACSAEQVGEREAFEKWAEVRGVWPRLTHEEIFFAGYRAAITAPAPERKMTDAFQDFALQAIGTIAIYSEDRAKEVAEQYRTILNQQGEQNGWMQIETAPKDGTRIMLGRAANGDQAAVSTIGWWQDAIEDGIDYMGGDAGFVDIDFQEFSPGRSFGNRQYAATQPTHWKPIAAAPTAQKDG